MKTREEVEKLKQDWLADGCWDIEKTEGFEDYTDELLKFRRKMERIWKREKARHHAELAEKYCPMTFSCPDCDGYCKVEKCAWWNKDNEKCGAILR